jgi:hypothetical protein
VASSEVYTAIRARLDFNVISEGGGVIPTFLRKADKDSIGIKSPKLID